MKTPVSAALWGPGMNKRTRVKRVVSWGVSAVCLAAGTGAWAVQPLGCLIEPFRSADIGSPVIGSAVIGSPALIGSGSIHPVPIVGSPLPPIGGNEPIKGNETIKEAPKEKDMDKKEK